MKSYLELLLYFRGDDYYLLQKYSQQWSEFIDVTDINEIEDGDHLKVVPVPSTRKKVGINDLKLFCINITLY